MKKAIAIAISLVASSSGFANSTDFVNTSTSAPLNIKFSDLTQSGKPYCMYSTVISSEGCSAQLIACSGNDEFAFQTDLAAYLKHYNMIKVKNEQTQEIVAEGAVTYSFDLKSPRFKIADKLGLQNMNYYHTDQGIEFFLKPEPTKAAILFSEEEYIGNQLEVISDQADLGYFNADMDSYVIPEGWTLRFYENKNFEGRYYTRGEMRNGIFDSNDFDPRIQSIRVVKEGDSLEVLEQEDIANPAVILFTEEGKTGKQLRISSDLANLGIFNSDIDSYTIPENWVVRFYEGKNFQGGYHTRGWGVKGLGIIDNRKFEPRVQSVQVLDRHGNEIPVIFSAEDHQGNQLEITSNLADLGDFNLNVDSYTIPLGWTLRFFEGKNFEGRYHTRGQDINGTPAAGVGLVDQADFAPRVQSIRVLHQP